MSNALDAFRAQKEAAEQVHACLTEVSALLRSVQAQANAIAQDKTLRAVLQDEDRWLDQARRTLDEVRAFREWEMRRYWPAMWRRWAVAVVFALASAAAFGAGYVWATSPQDAELFSLRQRVEVLDTVAQRLVTMTPAELRQFDALMKWSARPGH